MRPGTDNFEVDIIDNFDGYVSSKDKTNVAQNVLVMGSQNVYKPISGNITVRPGLKTYGENNTDEVGIKSSYEWYTSLGGVYPLRVIGTAVPGEGYYDIVEGKLQVLLNLDTNPEWLTIKSDLTSGRIVFAPWWNNTEKKDRIVFVNGNSNLYSWSGGIATVSSATGDTITKTGISTWAQAGFSITSGEKKFLIGNAESGAQEYTYTGGENTTTLTGITPALPSLSGETIAQSVLTESNSPDTDFTNDFVKTIGNQLYVGSYTSRLVYISSATDFTDYVVLTPRVSGSPELLTLDNNPTGIAVRQGKAHISAGLSDWYIISFEDITVGTDLTQQTIVDKQETAALSAALAHEFIDTVGDDIVYLSQDQQLRLYGSFRNIFTAKYPSLSQPVRTELESLNVTGGAVRSIGERVYLTSPLTGKTYFYVARESVDGSGNVVAERFWNPPQVWNVSRIALINGVEYGHSNQNPMIYQLWNTGQWHDDSPSGDIVPYDVSMCLAYWQNERRQGLTTFDKVYVEGYILQGSTLYMRAFKDYNDPAPETNILNDLDNPAEIFPDVNPEVIGGSKIGEVSIGGVTVMQGYFPKFRVISDCLVKDVFEYQIEIYSNTADSAWEILAVGVNATTSDDLPTFLQR